MGFRAARLAVGSNEGLNFHQLRRAGEFDSSRIFASDAQREAGFDFSDYEDG